MTNARCPMLTSFTVERYKPFVDRTRVELRPLTLLFGYNNSGKSALLRFLPMIADSLQGLGKSPLKRGPANRGGSFDDLVSRQQSSSSLEFELTWNETSAFKAEIQNLPERHRQVVTEFTMCRGEDRIEGSWIPEEDASGKPARGYELRSSISVPRELEVDFLGLVPSCRRSRRGALHESFLERPSGLEQWPG